jgi:hypothetical protein
LNNPFGFIKAESLTLSFDGYEDYQEVMTDTITELRELGMNFIRKRGKKKQLLIKNDFIYHIGCKPEVSIASFLDLIDLTNGIKDALTEAEDWQLSVYHHTDKF